VTFVYVTHDQTEALTMSDRVAVFNEGAIQQLDIVDNLYETPANRFVASFVGDSTVLNAQVSALDDLYCEVQLTDGTRLRGTNVNQAEVGQTVQCGIRPERLQIAQSPLPNSMQARVADIMYFGDHLRLRCLLKDQPDAMVKMPLAHHLLPEIGQSVVLHAPEEHLRVYR
jgi:putative spermidine/putrescine transport system ATP-binding protein